MQATGSKKHLLECGAAGGGARHRRLRQDRARDAPRHVELVRRVQRLAAPADVERRHQSGGAVPQRDLQGARASPEAGGCRAAGPARPVGTTVAEQLTAGHPVGCGTYRVPLPLSQ
jgi:hypothetical protein